MRKTTHEEFIDEAIARVADYENNRKDISEKITIEDVFTVWSCKIQRLFFQRNTREPTTTNLL